MGIIGLLIFLFLLLSFIMLAITIPFWFDRVVVYLIRRLNMPVYSTAVMVAMSIVQHPEQWIGCTHEIRHKTIGDIWTANGAYGLYVMTAQGKWFPNRIERRIIREAVDWRLESYLKNQIRAAILKDNVTGKITDV